MPSEQDEIELEKKFESIEAGDEIYMPVIEKIHAMLARSGCAPKCKGLKIYVSDFSKADPDFQKSDYFTENCQILMSIPAVVINVRFLMEIESALRSFDISESLLDTQYLKSDEDLFILVDRIGTNLKDYLSRLRRLDRQIDMKRDGGQDVAGELVMVTFFFICHELGHLLAEKDKKDYGTFVGPDATLEQKVSNSVIKLCRHADDFVKHGFGLPGLEDAARADSDVRQNALEFQKANRVMCHNHDLWFEDEEIADAKATELVIEQLGIMSKGGRPAADLQQYLLIKGLFSVALYLWYKDMFHFTRKLSYEWTRNANMLALEMMKTRERYIQAASLFGEIHRFTLLRATLTVESILKARTGWFEQEADRRTIWYAANMYQRPSEEREMQKWWLAESLQRYCLLCISMDTAVKMAHIGCATGWIKKTDAMRNTPQLLMMQFESIRQAVDRLRKFR